MKRHFIKKPVQASSIGDPSNRLNLIKREIRNMLNRDGKSLDDVDDYLNSMYNKGLINDEQFSEFINWADMYIKGDVMSSTDADSDSSIRTYRNLRNPNKHIEVKKGKDGHSYMRQVMIWDTPNGEVRYHVGAKSSKGRFFRARQDTINQVLEDYEEVTDEIVTDGTVTAASDETSTSGVSFDFIHNGDYDEQAIENTLSVTFDNLGLELLGVDFRSVDYSGYPEYADKIVSQCGADFSWINDYDDAAVSNAIESAMLELGYEVIGSEFYSL